MEKEFLGGIMRRWHLAIVAVLVCIGFNAKADDLGAIELGKKYAVTMFHNYSGTLTAPETGTLTVDAPANSDFTLYADEALSQPLTMTKGDYNGVNQYCTCEVASGVKYWVANDGWIMDNSYVCFTMGAGASKLTASWTPGEFAHVSVGNSSINISLDKAVVYDKIVLYNQNYTENYTVAEASSAASDAISFNLDKALGFAAENSEDWFGTGADYNPNLHLKISGVMGNDGTAYKDLANNYIYEEGQEPPVEPGDVVTLVKAEAPVKLLSYFVPGDKEGILTLTFSGAIKNSGRYAPQAQIIYAGNRETNPDDYTVHPIPSEKITVNDNVVTVDLTGVKRLPADIFSSGSLPESTGLKVYGLYGLDNQPVDFGGGEMSYSCALQYEVVPAVNLSCIYQPANGTSLEGVDKIDMFISGFEGILFDGVEFNYGSEQASVVVKDYTVVNAPAPWPAGTKQLSVAIPEEVKGQKPVVVSLHNLQALDGSDQWFNTRAVYGGIVLIPISPVYNATLNSIPQDFEFKLGTNMPDANLAVTVKLEAFNSDGEKDWDYSLMDGYEFTMEKDMDGNYVWSYPYPDKDLYANFDYKITYTATGDNISETLVVPVFGGQPAFVFSEETVESVEPPLWTKISVDKDLEITVTYSWRVNIGLATVATGGSLVTVNPETTPAGDPDAQITGADGKIYSPVWTLKLDSKQLRQFGSGSLTINVKAYDEDGKLIEGNDGVTTKDSYYELSYILYSLVDLTATIADGATVKELTTMGISSSNVIYQSWDNDEEIVVMDANDNVVSQGEYADDEDPNNPWGDIKSGTVTFNPAVTTDGNYLIVVPEGYITVDNGMTINISSEMRINVTVDGKSSGIGTIDSAATVDGFTVYSVSGVKLLDNVDKSRLAELPAGIYIVNGEKYLVK